MGLCQGNPGPIALSPKTLAAVEARCTLEFIALWYHPLHSLRCDWDHIHMFTLTGAEFGAWGGEIRSKFTPLPGEILAQEHWCSSGFANTDLDLLLKRHGIHKLITIGLIAHTCLESTVRFAAELGYEVTVVRDATADYSDREMHAALDVNLPSYANAIITTQETVQSISSFTPLEIGAKR
jgi:nicotinamidase-related amidase